MYINEDNNFCAYISKDRTGVHDKETVEDLSLVDWQVIIDRTKDKKEFSVKNDLTKAVDIEQDIYRKEILGQVGEPTEEDTTSNDGHADIEAIKKEIIAKRNALPPIEKKAMKEKLEAAGLPTAYKNVTDVEILNKVLAMFD